MQSVIPGRVRERSDRSVSGIHAAKLRADETLRNCVLNADASASSNDRPTLRQIAAT
jgi:hypothetical protein